MVFRESYQGHRKRQQVLRMLRDGLFSILRKVADNIHDKKLEHREITALAHGALKILDDIEGISLYRNEIEILLKMLTTRAPHHARSSLANQAMSYLALCSLHSCIEDHLKKEQGQDDF